MQLVASAQLFARSSEWHARRLLAAGLMFWNAAARSVRFAASFAAAACICMQIARVLHRARDGLWYVLSGTRRDSALRTGKVLSNPILAARLYKRPGTARATSF